MASRILALLFAVYVNEFAIDKPRQPQFHEYLHQRITILIGVVGEEVEICGRGTQL
jgi:hypothetical protein